MNFAHHALAFTGERLTLRTLHAEDATPLYAGWLNDPEVNLFLATKEATVNSVRAFIEEKNAQENALFFGIFLKEDGKHIGTIKLEPIELEEKRATIAIMIGDKKQWGKGYAAEAMQLLIDWCFQELGCQEVNLGVIAKNTSAIRLYEKLGFEETHRDIGTVQYGDDTHDHVHMVLKKPS